MVKNEVKEIIRKRLRVAKQNKDKELLKKLKAEIPEEVKEYNSICKKIKQIDKQKEKLNDKRDILSESRKTTSKQIEKKSNGKLQYDDWCEEKIILNSSSEFDVEEEFDKIEEELILSDDKGGTLKDIFERISKM